MIETRAGGGGGDVRSHTLREHAKCLHRRTNENQKKSERGESKETGTANAERAGTDTHTHTHINTQKSRSKPTTRERERGRVARNEYMCNKMRVADTLDSIYPQQRSTQWLGKNASEKVKQEEEKEEVARLSARNTCTLD